MMLQGGGVPDTSAYYHAAYSWLALLYAGYAVSLWVRGRRIRDRLRAALDRDESTHRER